ncbi:DUF721 domain-containing protein [Buchananella hordeovulneris]|uniref:DUF721 domain-containing protein n=1 Tax=Buchananella hordeovulneris TaxID=52770 RepID=UPI000F5F864E|nr:DciA family protein [Buchananella hordeovulneris]RRD43438.1 DUF721 domain-containing protein [Buchananella hordeovulneris]
MAARVARGRATAGAATPDRLTPTGAGLPRPAQTAADPQPQPTPPALAGTEVAPPQTAAAAAAAWEPTPPEVRALALRALDRFRSAAWEKGEVRVAWARGPRRYLDEEDQTGENEGGWQPPPGVKFWGSGPGKSRRDPKRLGAVGERVLARLGLTEAVAGGKVAAMWPSLVGPQIADHTKVEACTDHNLVIRTDSTAWAQQLRILTPNLLARIEAAAGAGVITSLTILPPAAPSWRHGPRVVPGRGPRDTYG